MRRRKKALTRVWVFFWKGPPGMADVRDASGNTPSMMAASNGMAKTLLTLAKAGADAALTDKAGETMLHFATDTDDKETWKVAIGLSKGCLGAVDHIGMTALHCAAINNREELVVMLIETGIGAAAGIRDLDGDTALSLAGKATMDASVISALAAQTSEEDRVLAMERVRCGSPKGYLAAFESAVDEGVLNAKVMNTKILEVGKKGRRISV